MEQNCCIAKEQFSVYVLSGCDKGWQIRNLTECDSQFAITTSQFLLRQDSVQGLLTIENLYYSNLKRQLSASYVSAMPVTFPIDVNELILRKKD
jgi:hypothetical protein